MKKILLLSEKEKLSKCLKSYLIGKKYYESDINKSIEYFKQCILFSNNIKKTNESSIIDILDQTEIECIKYINSSIDSVLDLSYEKINDNSINLFELIETGDIDIIKKYKYNQINFKIYNNDGLTPLHYAIKYGDTLFIKESLKIGACIDEVNLNGHTLLEYACLEKDPNIINFLIEYGANMKTHLLFRKNNKYISNGNNIDIILLEIYILDNNNNNNKIKYLEWIFDYINPNEKINIDYNTLYINKPNNLIFYNLINSIDIILNNLDEDIRNTYILIIKEELSYNLLYKLECPKNKIEIILYNIIPFINYLNNFKVDWLLIIEIKFLILTILKKNKLNEIYINLKKLLYDIYIDTKIVSEGLIQILIHQIIQKNKALL